MAALEALGAPGAPGICLPCDGWPHGRLPRATGAGLEWFRHDGTGVANPGKHAMQRRSLCAPDLTDDIPDLHVDLLLHRPAWSFRSGSTDARYTSIARAALAGTVRGELVRFALSRDDTAALFAPGDPGSFTAILAAAAFRLWYPLAASPGLFDRLTPAGDVMSLRDVRDTLVRRFPARTPSLGCHFPPGLAGTDPWRTCDDQPFFEFAYAGTPKSEWRWFPSPAAGLRAAVPWHDTEGLAAIVALTEDADAGRAYAWTVDNAAPSTGP